LPGRQARGWAEAAAGTGTAQFRALGHQTTLPAGSTNRPFQASLTALARARVVPAIGGRPPLELAGAMPWITQTGPRGTTQAVSLHGRPPLHGSPQPAHINGVALRCATPARSGDLAGHLDLQPSAPRMSTGAGLLATKRLSMRLKHIPSPGGAARPAAHREGSAPSTGHGSPAPPPPCRKREQTGMRSHSTGRPNRWGSRAAGTGACFVRSRWPLAGLPGALAIAWALAQAVISRRTSFGPSGIEELQRLAARSCSSAELLLLLLPGAGSNSSCNSFGAGPARAVGIIPRGPPAAGARCSSRPAESLV